MAYLVTPFWPGATMGQYNATVTVMHNPWPEGQLYPAAVLGGAGLAVRIRAQERQLTQALGAEYERFAASRKRLVPGVW